MSEYFEPTDPIEPSDEDISRLDFKLSDDEARVAALREGQTDPKIMGIIQRLGRNEVDLKSIPTRIKEPANYTFSEEGIQNAIARRLVRRLAQQKKLIKSVDDQNPENWLS
jgi:hypothetical protein